MILAAMAAIGWPMVLATKGTVREGARIDLQHEDARGVGQGLFDGELHVHQAAHVQGEGHGLGLALQLGDGLGPQGERGQEQALVAECTPASSICSITPQT